VLPFGGAGDSVLVGPSAPLAVDSRGRFFAASYDRMNVLVFSPKGVLLSALGRRGQGPGEFDGFGINQLALDAADTLFVHSNGRVSVFSPQLKFVRSFRLPPSTVTGLRTLHDGTLLLGAIVRTADNIGYSYHILRRDGTIVRSFGDPRLSELGVRLINRSGRDFPPRVFAVASDEKSLWIAPSHHLRQLSLEGLVLHAFDINGAPWYPTPRESTFTGRGGQPIRMYVGAGSSDVAGISADGILWVAAEKPSNKRDVPSTYALDAFDSVTGRLIASRQTPLWLSFLSNGRAWSFERDADGVMSFTIWNVILNGRQP
jgi:hypothetical protein